MLAKSLDGLSHTKRQRPRAKITYPTVTRAYTSYTSVPRTPVLPVTRPRTHSKTPLYAGAVLLMLAVAGLSVLKPKQGKDITPGVANAASAVKAEKIVVPAKLDTAAMDAKIQAIITANPQLDISVSWFDIKTGDSKLYGVQEKYIAASIGKLVTASYFMDRVEGGEYTLETMIAGKTASEQLRLMIEDSDQTAWVELNNTLGKPRLETYARNIGLSNYTSADNEVTSADVALLLKKLYAGELMNKQHQGVLLGYMANANEQQYIKAAVPVGVKAYHKAGYLKDRAHDAAIIDNGKRPYILVIFTKSRRGDYDFTAGTKIINNITTATTETFLSATSD